MDRLSHALKFCDESKKHRESLPEIPDKTIYIIKCDKYYKIGYTKNMYERYHNYLVHNPLNLSILCNAKTPHFKEYERWIFGQIERASLLEY